MSEKGGRDGRALAGRGRVSEVEEVMEIWWCHQAGPKSHLLEAAQGVAIAQPGSTWPMLPTQEDTQQRTGTSRHRAQTSRHLPV